MLNVKHNVLLKDFCTFKIGGSADNFVVVNSKEELDEALGLERPFVLGNGSNVLFSDKGYRGTIIKLGEAFSNISLEGNTIVAGAGALLCAVAHFAQQNALSGLEFACGIPGSVGGAAVMNAGAYGHSICELLDSSEGFGYRQSPYKTNHETVTEMRFNLVSSDKDKILETMNEYNAQRREKQPLSYPSAGSFFKRPKGYFAGKLIEDSGLKGYSVGGAMVSSLHCGFIINTGNASCSDVLNLMKHVQKTVFEKFAVELEPEVIIINE